MPTTPCYDCGSLLWLEHSALCDLAPEGATRLPASSSKEGTQYLLPEVKEDQRRRAKATSCTCDMRDMDGGPFLGRCPTHDRMGECYECGDPAPIGTYQCDFCRKRQES